MIITWELRSVELSVDMMGTSTDQAVFPQDTKEVIRYKDESPGSKNMIKV